MSFPTLGQTEHDHRRVRHAEPNRKESVGTGVSTLSTHKPATAAKDEMVM